MTLCTFRTWFELQCLLSASKRVSVGRLSTWPYTGVVKEGTLLSYSLVHTLFQSSLPHSPLLHRCDSSGLSSSKGLRYFTFEGQNHQLKLSCSSSFTLSPRVQQGGVQKRLGGMCHTRVCAHDSRNAQKLGVRVLCCCCRTVIQGFQPSEEGPHKSVV